MTSGAAVKYRSSMHCMSEIVKNEGTKSLFKGAGANILRAVAGAGVLSGYDQLQILFLGASFDVVVLWCRQGLQWRQRINQFSQQEMLVVIKIPLTDFCVLLEELFLFIV
jgi:hypothetical protein